MTPELFRSDRAVTHAPGRARALPILAVCAMAVTAIAGCAKSSPNAHGATRSSGMPGSQALRLAADEARRVTSLSATLDVASTGRSVSALTGTLAEQVKPLLFRATFQGSLDGTAMTGGVETIMTSGAVYAKVPTMAAVTHKPWVKLSFTALKGPAAAAYAPLMNQFRAVNPTSQTEMLASATGVRDIGTGTIGGAAVTGYSGTLKLTSALASVDPALRKIVGPGLTASGFRLAHFRVWVTAQHLVRKLVEVTSGNGSHITTQLVITSVNKPVSVTIPPASQVGTAPGLFPGSHGHRR